MKKARLTVLAGPTAVGKGSVVRELIHRYPQVWVSVSATTRAPRPTEVDGVDYFFVSDEAFFTMVESGQMLEWAVVHGRNKYGTPKPAVDRALGEGRPVLLEIDLAGVQQLRASSPDALFVFLAPPSWEELVSRLEGRGTENADERERRLATARVELAAQDQFDEIVINDDLDEAVLELARLMGLE